MCVRCRVAILVLVAPLLACDGTPSSAFAGLKEFVGVTAPPPQAPVLAQLLCDASRMSTCSPQSLGATLDVVLPVLVGRAGSQVEVWGLGTDVATTQLVAREVVPVISARGRKAQARAVERWMTQAQSSLRSASAVVFAGPARRRSPIAEGLTKMSLLAPPPGMHRVLMLISDARPVEDVLDAECGPLPTTSVFLKRLHQRRLLLPGSLAGTRVVFSFVTHAQVDRGCTLSIERLARTQELLVAAVGASGGTSVWRGGVVQPTDVSGGPS